MSCLDTIILTPSMAGLLKNKNKNKTKLHELDVLYKKVAKIALGVEKTESSINVYKDMKWHPLHLRRQVHLSSYMLKILNGQSPSNFINKFKFISGGSRNGANCNLYTPKSKNLKTLVQKHGIVYP